MHVSLWPPLPAPPPTSPFKRKKICLVKHNYIRRLESERGCFTRPKRKCVQTYVTMVCDNPCILSYWYLEILSSCSTDFLAIQGLVQRWATRGGQLTSAFKYPSIRVGPKPLSCLLPTQDLPLSVFPLPVITSTVTYMPSLLRTFINSPFILQSSYTYNHSGLLFFFLFL